MYVLLDELFLNRLCVQKTTMAYSSSPYIDAYTSESIGLRLRAEYLSTWWVSLIMPVAILFSPYIYFTTNWLYNSLKFISPFI